MGKPALAIGGVALIVVGAGIALGWNWWPNSARAEASADVTQPVSVVQIDNDSGDVRVRIEDTATTSVHQTYHYRGDRPGDAFTVDGGRLRLDGCGRDCTVDYDIVAPRGTTVNGEVRSGDLTVYGAASADLRTSSGDIEVRDVTGPVTTNAKSGDIEVRLSVPQDVRAETASGDVRVVVPRDRYRVSGNTMSGDRHIDVAQDPAAQHVLEVSSTSGDVSVAQA
ncbi:DUF4097 family beta strand repeat-containing protein [Amycolatopsis granulosa]|uniref:DUF4097 family beta strand repeat-containing protein n=1 Tax=Amycolatopsis granulosa TaxID=185684 RepID=UPI001424A73B|nr:DUF4097 family beta strand repeat-containing protein [Amycolatopsis granulosa]NIH86553.1 hypothetical protein [Amycolatopsis granulosa]